MKIASLLASNTEIAYALGLEEQIVGVSHECDYPPQVNQKPILTKSKIDPTRSSREIDLQVKNLLKTALSVYEVDEGKLRELKPDIILTQDQCEVCAVSLKDVEQAVSKNICQAKIVSLKPETFDDVLKIIEIIGHATQKEKEAKNLLAQLYQRITNVKNKTKSLKNKPKVCCIEWLDPIMIAGNWVPEMVEMAGGIPILSKKGKHSKTYQLKDILKENPNKIVISPCGFKIEQTLKDIVSLTEKLGWERLEAIQNDEVYIADGNSYFNRPSQRIVDTLEILAAILHPKLFTRREYYQVL